MKRIVAVIMSLACLLTLSACKSENMLGVSYDCIVCDYSYGGGFGTIYDVMGMSYTVYADNYIRVHTGVTEHTEYHVDVPITEEQKQEIISMIKKYKVWNIGDTSNDYVLDAGSTYFSLFDKNGEEVCSSGGYASSNVRIAMLGRLIMSMVPADVVEEVEFMAEKVDRDFRAQYSEAD